MAVTRDFKELVQKRVARDPAFADALLREGIDTMLAGDVDTGKAILRDYIKATIGFEKLGAATGTPAKSLIRMSARAAIRRRAISSASSATCRSRPASSCMSRRGQFEKGMLICQKPDDDSLEGVVKVTAVRRLGRAPRPPSNEDLRRKGAPLRQCGRASLLVNLPGDEMALLIELVVDLGVN